MTIVLGAALISGCAVGPDYVQPELSPPDAWTQPAPATAAELADWWEQFGDEQLTTFVHRSTEGNLDLEVAYERIVEARHLLHVTAVRRLPSLDGTQAVTRSDSSADTSGVNGSPVWVYDIGLSVAWELDVFGRVQRSVEAATADLQTVVEDYRSVMTSLHANVASAYIDVRLAQRRLSIARGNLDIQKASLSYASDRHDAGLVPELDVAQAGSNIATTEASIPSLEADLDRAIYRLSVLVGSSIAPIRTELLDAQPIPAAPADIAIGLPANLLRNRPDLRAAERSLAAETARIGIAAADQYPSFDLAATLGGQALQVSDVLKSRAHRWSIGVNGISTLFNFGGITANIEAQKARARQALATYEQTLLLSIEEVEAALSTHRRERVRAEALRRAVAANQRSIELSELLYLSGQVDFQNLRDTQRALLDVQDQLAVSEAAISQNTISLFLALGGSWSIEEDLFTPRNGTNE